MTSEEEVARSTAAERLLDEPLFREACIKVEENNIQRMLNADSPADREAAHAQVHALRRVVEQLKIVVSHGQLAAAKLAQANKNRTGPSLRAGR